MTTTGNLSALSNFTQACIMSEMLASMPGLAEKLWCFGLSPIISVPQCCHRLFFALAISSLEKWPRTAFLTFSQVPLCREVVHQVNFHLEHFHLAPMTGKFNIHKSRINIAHYLIILNLYTLHILHELICNWSANSKIYELLFCKFCAFFTISHRIDRLKSGLSQMLIASW